MKGKIGKRKTQTKLVYFLYIKYIDVKYNAKRVIGTLPNSLRKCGLRLVIRVSESVDSA